MGLFVFSFSEVAKMLKNVPAGDLVRKDELKSLFGGKGYNLAKIFSAKLPVPPGFIVSVKAFEDYHKSKNLSNELMDEIKKYIRELEIDTNRVFNVRNDLYDDEKERRIPLLVSVRSGSKISMPGMLDTILNLGMNDNSANRMYEITNNKKFVMGVYLRFIQMFADVVKKVPKSEFDNCKINSDDFLQEAKKYKDIYKKFVSEDFPDDPYLQIKLAIGAVFASWNSSKAVFYRKMNSISSSLGTAVNIQMMVFGNYGQNSGTGVVFSRNPIHGDKELFGEYLPNAQGEDVVAGHSTPHMISYLNDSCRKIYEELEKYSEILEAEFKDMQDIEFTIENGKLYILQTRSGKRSSQAAIKICVDLIKENKISVREAISRIELSQIEMSIYSSFSPQEVSELTPIANGLSASPGVASGVVVFNTSDAKKEFSAGKNVILVRKETSPEDIEGIQFSSGILTSCGGVTSHAAVIARGMGKCCIVGCSDIEVEEDHFNFKTPDGIRKVKSGDSISLDCCTGNIYLSELKTYFAEPSEEFKTFMSYVDSFSTVKVYANADNKKDLKKSLDFGASGVGLCRTEHMFFGEERIEVMREMILAKGNKKSEAIKKLLSFQKQDFLEMFLEAKGMPVTIRFLDPPLHEFLPKTKEAKLSVMNNLEMKPEEFDVLIESFSEFNPMMGHRGSRLLISYPEIIKMQTEAVITAALEAKERCKDIDIVPEIMIPFINHEKEIEFIVGIIRECADSIILNSEINLDYKIGTMIELPRAALVADKLATYVDFFSFGTNDLTQTTYGISRDDFSKVLKDYRKNNIYKFDPFCRIDEDGVGALIKMAIRIGKKGNKNLKIGVCGEHGGEHHSIRFFESIGVDYVSCSPYRVLSARFSSALARIERKN
ncbi:MAG: pyruvate, phosphate dikinase [Candidatus Improbicoccus pseudotrichonymphae]|uniref:Pyruvate, phosphate dikinase n=1 Tax=Candidatus Improbicoccus pseudotrichonymphae TaxID=3033792 RepID=A0AA48I182_9FIRM|nr:MAG: pyruvate, phosphate dikinase [Candidatus Improbicoccus pseudotrichonymphae]